MPQFIEVEDKIVGPLTLRQFIYLAGTAGICAVLFAYLPRFIAIVLSLPIGALGAALAFYKVNKRPFVNLLEAGFSYLTHEKLMVWKQPELEAGDQKKQKIEEDQPVERTTPRLTRGKLAELSWSLDVKDNLAKRRSKNI